MSLALPLGPARRSSSAALRAAGRAAQTACPAVHPEVAPRTAPQKSLIQSRVLGRLRVKQRQNWVAVMSVDEEQAFERAVVANLRAGLHTRRGVTEEQYRALCRMAWESCSTSPEFPVKILIDPLRPVESILQDSTNEYVHWRAAESLESTRKASTEIRCSAVGAVKPDLSTDAEHAAPPDAEEPDVVETRRYILGVFDVLGFSALLASRGLDAVRALYQELIAEAVTKEAVRAHNLIRLNRSEMCSVMFSLPVRHAHFSDTVLLWVPLVQHFIAPFMARCADMVCEALQIGLPLRGALAVGPAIMHAPSGTFIGTPLVEAARLEHAQDWLGVALGPSMLAHDVSREFDPHVVLPYRIPLKRGTGDAMSGFALDWPGRFRTRYKASLAELIQSLNTSPRHSRYYDNALKFAEFSVGPVFRSEGLHPLGLRRIAAAAVEARAGQAALGWSEEQDLKDLTRVGPAGATVAEYLRAVATGGHRPELSAELPRRVRSLLRDTAAAASGSARFFAVGDLIIAAITQRFRGAALSEEILGRIADMDTYSPSAAAVARFIRELGSGGSPAIPRNARADMRPLLKDALEWALGGRVPGAILQRTGNDCLKTRFGYGDLDEGTLQILGILEGMDGAWPAVAGYFRAVAAGVEKLSVPVHASRQIRENLSRVGLSATLAGVQLPKTLEIMSVGFGDPHTGVDLRELVNDLAALRRRGAERIPAALDKAIDRFAGAANERAPVADRLRAFATGAPAGTGGDDLPVALRLFLAQMDAVGKGAPIPIDPELVGLAAIRCRFAGGAMGDCILFSVRALLSGKKECRAMATYFLTVAQGGPAAPAPVLQELGMRSAVEEVRCLADRAVGGFRMLMSRARPETAPDDQSSPE